MCYLTTDYKTAKIALSIRTMNGCFQQRHDDKIHNDEIYNFIKNVVPKVELHAHLNGCIPSDLLHTLANERDVTLSSKFHDNSKNRSLEDCFDMFRELPNVINDLTSIAQITRAALEQFAYHHSTFYLELRTTPKRLLYDFHCDGTDTIEKCTKREYMETILRTVQQFEEADQKRYEDECRNLTGRDNDDVKVCEDDSLPRLPMTCRIIISVDRSQSLSEATENIDLAIALHQETEDSYVVGVDLGGNPTQQDFCMFESLFQKARDAGLKVTIHCAEIACPSVLDNHTHIHTGSTSSTSSIIHSKEYKEIQRILQFRPDRIGHGVLLPQDLLIHLEELQIPVETCPTSNVLTLQMFHHDHYYHHDEGTNNNSTNKASPNRIQTIVHGLQNHHYTIQHWLKEKYPIIICTDDPGIFDTSITNELYIVYQAFQQTSSSFGLLDLVQLVENSINYAFCSETIRTKMKHQLQQRIRVILERRQLKGAIEN